jgi:hypothetical protein
MRIALFVALLATALGSPAEARREIEVRRLTGSFPIAGAQTVRLELAPGEYDVVAGPGNEVVVDLGLECDRPGGRCEERADDIRLRGRIKSDALVVWFDDFPDLPLKGPSLRGSVTVPRGRPLVIQLGVGELRVESRSASARSTSGCAKPTPEPCA